MDRELLFSLNSHNHEVFAVALTSDTKFIVSGSEIGELTV